MTNANSVLSEPRIGQRDDVGPTTAWALSTEPECGDQFPRPAHARLAESTSQQGYGPDPV